MALVHTGDIMRLEAGKRYKDRRGNIYGPLQCYKWLGEDKFAVQFGAVYLTWDITGRGLKLNNNTPRTSNTIDLVREYTVEEDNQGLKLFVWSEFSPLYHGGLAFAIANNEDEARGLVIAKVGFKPREWGILTIHPVDTPVAYGICGSE